MSGFNTQTFPSGASRHKPRTPPATAGSFNRIPLQAIALIQHFPDLTLLLQLRYFSFSIGRSVGNDDISNSCRCSGLFAPERGEPDECD
jgi:hypothetical protein